VIPSRYLLGICLTLLGGCIVSPAAAQPALVVNDISVTEPTGGTALATFTVSYTDGQPHGATIIFVTTASGQSSAPSVATGGASCSGNVDYISVNNAGHTFTTASTTFTVTVCGDAHDEADQQFLVNVTARGAAVQDGQGIGTIVDDDATPVFSVGDSRVSEGAEGAVTQAAFTLTLTGATERSPTVTYESVNGSAIGGTCGQGADYEQISRTVSAAGTSLSLTPPQNLTQIVLIKFCGDNVSEGDQTFEIRLSNATNATIGDVSATITIVDDDPVPTLSITPTLLVSEPTALQPQAEAVFFVTFAGPSTEQPVVVNYATAAGTATAGSACGAANGHPAGDFVSQTGTLNFSPGKKVQEIRVPICADTVIGEPNETFSVTLVRATNARIAQGVGTATIR